MLVLSQNIKRIVNRIESTIQNDIEKGVQYPASIAVNGIVHTGEKAISRHLEVFQDFKNSLEQGTNTVLQCYDDQKEEAMLELVGRIWDFYEPFTKNQIDNIENEAIIDEGLSQRLKNFRKKFRKDKVAEALTNFFNNPCGSSWGQEDAYCGLRIFKLVSTSEEYEEILKREPVEDITSDKPEECLNIRVAFSKIDEGQVIEEKGLKYDFRRFMCKFAGQESLYTKIEKYKIWFGIRRNGIYYIYIPEI